MKKKILSILIVMILLVSMLGITTALAASVSIKGNSEVQAGKSYTYEVTVSADCFNFVSQVSCGGVFSGGSVACDAGGSTNGSYSKTVSIKVTVAADAQPGATGTISVNGSGCSIDENSVPVGEFGISESKTATVVVKSSTPPSPSSNKDNNNDDEPKATPTPTEWDLAEGQVDGLAQGGTLAIDITGDSRSIPASIYNAIREKQGVVTLNFGSYTCTLNGAALGELDEDAKKLNLGLSLEADPDLSAAVGGADVYQLHFSHEGEFPGKISFSFKADKSAPGDTVYLYYYRSGSGVTEGIQSAVVDANGYVTFDIYHCSSYFVSGALIEGAAGIVAAPEPTPSPTPEPTATPSPTPEPTEEPVKEVAAPPVVTGFSLPVLIAVGAGAALIAVIITLAAVKAGPFKKRSRHAA